MAPEATSPRFPTPFRHLRLALVLLAAALMLLHCLRFRDFTVDDAAISYAYAQNFAHGDGLVGHAGGERVEGYSNFSWVMLLAAGIVLAGHVMVLAKVLGAALALVIVWGAAELLAALRRRRSPFDAVPALLCAAFMPIAYWSMSGLENPLYLALLVWCGVRLVREANDATLRPWSALLACGVALTRPDGILLAAVAGATQLWLAPRPRRLIAWAALAGGPVALFFAWRHGYYAYWFPNTYYAKVDRPPRLAELVDVHAVGWSYVRRFAERYQLTATFTLAGCALLTRAFRPRLALLAIALAAFYFPVYSRGDWMSEGRFVVTALPLWLVLACDGIEQLVALAAGLWRQRPALSRRVALAIGGALVLLLGWTLVPNALRLSAARQGHYPNTVNWVSARAHLYDDLARALAVAAPSAADGDAGGNLLDGTMPFVDIGWLADGTLSHWGRNRGFAREYILNERRPTFFHMAGFWLDNHFHDEPESAEYIATGADGLYVARSAVTAQGIDTRTPLAGFGRDVALLGFERTATELHAWLLSRVDHPSVPLQLRGAGGDRLLVAGRGFFPPQYWRAGEVVQLLTPLTATARQLCVGSDCVTLDPGCHGAQPAALPATSAADVERLRGREEWEAARAAAAHAGLPTRALAAPLLARAAAAEAEGDTGAAFADLGEVLRADPSRAAARRRLEELRPSPRAGYHPLVAVELAATTRAQALAPTAERLGALAALALAAHDPLPAVRAHQATALAPTDGEAALALAEDYLAAGFAAEGAALVPAEPADDLALARAERLALAGGRRDLFERLRARDGGGGQTVAPGLALAGARGHLDSDGGVALDLLLRREAGAAPDQVTVAGRVHRLRRSPRSWQPGELVRETVTLPPSSGRSHVAIGSAGVTIDVTPFAADFERGRSDGWSATGAAFASPLRTQEQREAFGVQGDRYLSSSGDARGELASPPLTPGVARACLSFDGGPADGAFLRAGERIAAVTPTAGHGMAWPLCLPLPADRGRDDWRLVLVAGGGRGRLTADDVTCFTADDRPVPCAGQVTVALDSPRR